MNKWKWRTSILKKESILAALLKASISSKSGILHYFHFGENPKLASVKLFMQMSHTELGYSVHA